MKRKLSLAVLCSFLSVLFLTASAAAFPPGDVNGSGIVNQVDATLIRDHLIERAPLTGAALARADANQDGKVDLADIAWIQGHYSPPELASTTWALDAMTTVTASNVTTATITLSGNGAPAVQVGDIVSGSAGGGFLRRVTGIQAQGADWLAQTDQASVAEAVKNGQMSGTFVLVEDAAAAPAHSLAWAPATPANRRRAQSVTVDLSGTTVYDDANLSVRILSGSITFTPEISVEGSIEGFSLKYFRVFLTGHVATACTMRAEVTNPVSIKITNPGWTIPLLEIPISPAPIPIAIGPVPIVLDLKGTVGPSLSVTVPSSMNVQDHLNLSLECGAGAEYRDGEWRPLATANGSASGGIDEWGVGVFDAKLAYRASIGLQFYKVAGPYIKFGPYVRAAARVTPSFSTTLYTGLDAALSLDLKLLDWLSLSYQVADWTVWETPVARFAPTGTGTVAVDATPDTGEWLLTGPVGFTANGQICVGDRTFPNAPLGSYRLTSRDNVAGLTPPPVRTQALAADKTISFSPAWTPEASGSGTVTVDATPNTGEWILNGPAGFADNGVVHTGDRTFTNSPVGQYQLVCHDNVVGLDPPAPQTLTLAAGGTLSFTPVWTPETSGAIQMVSIAAGTFTMGRRDDGDDGTYGNSDELPRHQVTLSAYEIGKFKVTNGEFADMLNWANGRGYLEDWSGAAWTPGNDVYASGQFVLGLTDYYCAVQYTSGTFTWKTRAGTGGDYSMEHHPVVDAKWYGCVCFCNWLSEREGRTPAYDLATWELVDADPATSGTQFTNGYRLPTEAEWERAAAWDGSKHWIYGFASDTLSGWDRANVYDHFGTDTYVNPMGLKTYPPYTSPVGWFNGVNVSPNGSVQTVDSPSPAGCYDMSGNFLEWCHDWYDVYGSGAVRDPKGPASGSYRVLRGGMYDSVAGDCRSAYRDGYYPAARDTIYGGLRLARTP